MKPKCEECKKELAMNDQLQPKKIEGKRVCIECFSKNKGIPTASENIEKIEKEGPVNRYKDAYLHSRAIRNIGSTVKGLGVVLAGIIVLGAFAIEQPMAATFAVAGIIIYVFGILISSAGQIHEAVLDTAVSNSPFLTKEEMKKVMSLS